jgi:hypothetical protein
MAKMIPAAERIIKARELIQKAREVPVPVDGGKYNFGYIAQVKAILQDARDMVKFIPYSPIATKELKDEVNKIYEEAEQANKEILH